MFTRTNADLGDENDAAESIMSPPDEFFTQTSDDYNMAHVDTDYDDSGGEGSPSHRLGVSAPTPLTVVADDTIDTNLRNDGYRSASSGSMASETSHGPNRNKATPQTKFPGKGRGERGDGGAGWQLGRPYYRTDGPGTTVLGPVDRENPGVPGNGSTTVQMYHFTKTMVASSSVHVEGVEGQNTMQYSNANHHVIAIEAEQHAHGAAPLEHSAHQVSTCRNAQQYQPKSPVTGYMAPMADAANSSRAPYPAQYLHAQYAQRWGPNPSPFRLPLLLLHNGADHRQVVVNLRLKCPIYVTETAENRVGKTGRYMERREC